MAGTYKEILNSDDEAFGGSGAVHNKSVRTHKKPLHGFEQSITITLPPMSTLYFEVPAKRTRKAAEDKTDAKKPVEKKTKTVKAEAEEKPVKKTTRKAKAEPKAAEEKPARKTTRKAKAEPEAPAEKPVKKTARKAKAEPEAAAEKPVKKTTRKAKAEAAPKEEKAPAKTPAKRTRKLKEPKE